jgi:hypothetical protein
MLRDLLQNGTREDLRHLARGGAFDDVAALLPPTPDPADPLQAAALEVLLWGFFTPRRDYLALDLSRACGPALDALSSGAVRPYEQHPLRRGWGHFELPEPVLHPLALPAWSAAAGTPEETLRALERGEVYIGDGGGLHLWPWWPHQEALRPEAGARAAKLGVGMPERHLGAPWDPPFYLERTGLEALLRWLADRGVVDPEGARIRRLPLPPHGACPPVRFEGGQELPGPGDRLRDRLMEVATWYYEAGSAESRAGLGDLLTGWLAAWGAPVEAPAPPPTERLEAAGPPPAGLPGWMEPPTSPEPFRTLRGLFTADSGLVLAYRSLLVHLDRELRVAGTWRYRGQLRCVLGDRVITRDDALHVLDLSRGGWLEGAVELPRGLLEMADCEETLSPDGRYLWQVARKEDVVVRLDDGVPVAGDLLFRCYGEAEDLPVLLRAPPPFGEEVVLDGVRFTLRAPGAHRVEGEGKGLAFTLYKDRWRIFAGGRLLEGEGEIAEVGCPTHAAAFEPSGEVLWLLTDAHLLRVRWGEVPALDGCWSLAPLGALFEMSGPPAEVADALLCFGDRAGLAAAGRAVAGRAIGAPEVRL